MTITKFNESISSFFKLGIYRLSGTDIVFYLIFSNRKTHPVIWGRTFNDLDKL